MFNQDVITEHMSVIAQDGVVVGRVDCVEAGSQTVKLAPDLEEQVPHWIPLAWVHRVDERGLHITKNAAGTQAAWHRLTPQPTAHRFFSWMGR